MIPDRRGFILGALAAPVAALPALPAEAKPAFRLT